MQIPMQQVKHIYCVSSSVLPVETENIVFKDFI